MPMCVHLPATTAGILCSGCRRLVVESSADGCALYVSGRHGACNHPPPRLRMQVGSFITRGAYASKMMEMLDTSRDGGVQYEELLAAAPEKGAPAGPQVKQPQQPPASSPPPGHGPGGGPTHHPGGRRRRASWGKWLAVGSGAWRAGAEAINSLPPQGGWGGTSWMAGLAGWLAGWLAAQG
jgi:hypothetical protein